MPGGAPEGYTGQMSLGGSTFTLAIDASGFKQQLDSAESTARASSAKIGQSFGRGSQAGMGLLYLGQAVDDIQYGFRSIVNNIPQIAMAVGGGAGLAGGIGILAVAISQVINHIDEFQALAENSEPIRKLVDQVHDLADAMAKVAGVDTSKGGWETLARLLGGGMATTLFKSLDALDIGPDQMDDAARIAREKAAGEAAGKKVGGVKGKEEQERAAAFKKAVEEYGGGDKLVADYAARLMNRPGMTQGRANGLAAQAIQSGLEGTNMAAGQFGNAFEKVLGKILMDIDTEKLTKAAKPGEELMKELQKDKDRETRDLNQQAQENERRLKDQLGQEREGIQERLKAEQERLSAIKPSQMFSSMKDYLSAVAVGGADAIRKQQLDVQKGIKKELEKVNKQIAAIGHARFD